MRSAAGHGAPPDMPLASRSRRALALIYEALLLRELGYGEAPPLPDSADWPATMAVFDRIGRVLARYPLADRRTNVMAARAMLRERLAGI